MSLFDLIRYPVDRYTVDFNHLPDKIWAKYMSAYNELSVADRREARLTNKLLIRIILEHEE